MLGSYLCACTIARRKLPVSTRWQIIGMRNADFWAKIFRPLGHSQSVTCCLLNSFQQTNHVQDTAHLGRPRKTSRKDNGLRLVRRFPFSNNTVVKQRWLPNRPLSTRIVRNRLRASGYCAGRPFRLPLLTPGQKVGRLHSRQQRRNWNIRTLRKVYWSEKRRFLLHIMDDCVRVRRQ